MNMEEEDEEINQKEVSNLNKFMKAMILYFL